MSVRLRAPEGGFWIEMASPETQWIENTLGLLSDDYASWRWIVTPQRRGLGRPLFHKGGEEMIRFIDPAFALALATFVQAMPVAPFL